MDAKAQKLEALKAKMREQFEPHGDGFRCTHCNGVFAKIPDILQPSPVVNDAARRLASHEGPWEVANAAADDFARRFGCHDSPWDVPSRS